MEIYLIRHGEAAASGQAGADGARALTDRGRREVAGVGAGLRALGVALDRILTSPLRRAQETADLLAREFAADAPIRETLAELDGSAPPAAILAALGGVASEETVAVIGHMPGLGELVTLAITGVGASGIPLATASVARIDFEGRPRPGSGRLGWLMNAEQLAGFAHGNDARK